MSPYLLIPFLAIAAAAQASVIAPLPSGTAKPDLLLMIVVAWGIVRGGGEATLWGLGSGLVLDLLSGIPFGIQTIGLGAVGLLADLMETNFFRSNILIPLAAIFVATFLFHIIQGAAMQTVSYPVAWQSFITRSVLPSAVLNTGLMPLIYGILRRIDHAANPRLGW